MSEFSDRPFVAGTVTGIRQFNVDGLGRLTGVSHNEVWRPGENQGICAGRRQFSYEKPHQVAKVDCACGFYAYFSPKHRFYDSSVLVRGIIEGWGTVTVGTKGFRAEKAKIVALVAPSRWKWVWRTTLPLLGLVAALWWSLTAWFGEAWVQGAFSVLVFAIAAAVMYFSVEYLYWDRVPKKVRANYPDVKIYSSVRKALREHPTTRPPEPSPKDEDFWTRTV